MNATERPWRGPEWPASKPPLEPAPVHTGRLWPFLLILLGVLLLLDSLGIQTWGLWNALAVGWPLLLIVLGVEVLTRRHAWGRALTLGTLLLGAVLVGLWSVRQPALGTPPRREVLEEPIQAPSAELRLATGVGPLEIGSSSGALLLEGSLTLRGSETLERTLSTVGDTQRVGLRVRSAGPTRLWPQAYRDSSVGSQLRLSPRVFWVLRVDTGVGDSRLDLSALKVRELVLNAGVGDTELILPASGRVTAQIRGGVGALNISVPQGMAAQIRATRGLGEVQVSGALRREGELYTSSGFERAAQRAELEVRGGVGQVSVEVGR